MFGTYVILDTSNTECDDLIETEMFGTYVISDTSNTSNHVFKSIFTQILDE